LGWAIVFSLVAGLVLLYAIGRRNERAVWRDWELVLTPKGQTVYRTIEERVETELAIMKTAYDNAHHDEKLGSLDEARHLLQIGHQVIERFSPSMMRLLAITLAFSRMVSAMAPIEPLRPSDFKLRQLASLAYLNRVLHQFLVSTGERFRLRVYILGQGFGLAARYLVKSTERIVASPTPDEQEWAQIDRIQDDLHTLSVESLRSFRALLTSLTAERKDEVLELINP
jgi:hypothetical protein